MTEEIIEETTDVEVKPEPIKKLSIEEFRQAKEQRVKSNSRFWTYKIYDPDGDETVPVGEIEFRTMLPTPRIERDAEVYQIETFAKLLSEGCQTETQIVETAKAKEYFKKLEDTLGGDIDEVLGELRGDLILKEARFKELVEDDVTDEQVQNFRDSEDWEEIRNLTTELFIIRRKILAIINSKDEITKHSVEAKSQFAHDGYVVVNCTYVGMENERLWDKVDDFLDEPDTRLVSQARGNLSMLRMGIRPQDEVNFYRNQFPENKIIVSLTDEEKDEIDKQTEEALVDTA